MSENTKFPDSFTEGQFVKYIGQSEIQGLVGSLGHSVAQQYEGQELIVLGILKGSMMFMADLIREIRDVKVYVDFVSLSSVGREKESMGSILMNKDLSVDIHDKNVLIVDEIIDTGRALHFLTERLKLSSPRSLKIAALFDKPYKRTVPIRPDFLGKKIDDQFLVGYGLDLEEYGRNFSDIYFLKYPN